VSKQQEKFVCFCPRCESKRKLHGKLRMSRVILDLLEEIEIENDVHVVFACESGSRAWGFASDDSDYDVRFIYVNRPEWYLSINNRRDVIELPIENDLDINGWDLKKALNLFRKSNPPLIEWLGSPIVYQEVTPIASWMRDLLPTYYSPQSCIYHYLHMAKRNFREYLRRKIVLRKKYLYVIRPIVSILWTERDMGISPTIFQTAVDAVIDDSIVREAINHLLDDKRSGKEMGYGPIIPELNNFITKELNRLAGMFVNKRIPRPRSSLDYDPVNKLFRKAIKEAWRQDVLQSQET